jgi:hypothetical protein
MKDPVIVERLMEVRRQAMEHAMMRLQSAASAAVTCLCTVQQDGESESAKVSSAKAILEMALHVAQIADIEERILKLVQTVKASKWKGSGDDHHPDQEQAGSAREPNGHA